LKTIPDIADLLTEILTAAGHETRSAPDGLQGSQRVAEERPDLILAEAKIPILDGLGMGAALATQRAGAPPIPIALVSGSRDLQRMAGRVGTPYYLKKPFHASDAIALVRRVLAAWPPR
jgi:DNA-binding response OmpR family regulator